jgi:hypothetical protein
MTTEAEKARRRKLEDEAERRKAEFLGIPILPSFGLFGDEKTDLVSGVDVSPETLAKVKPVPQSTVPTATQARGILTGEDQLVKDRLINYESYPEVGEGLLKQGINPEYAKNVALGKVPGVTVDDISKRFQDPLSNNLTDLIRKEGDLPSKSVMMGGTPGVSIMTGQMKSPVLEDIYDLGTNTAADTTGADLMAGLESSIGLLSKVMMMRGLLDNTPQVQAAAPRGTTGLSLQEEDLYKKYRGLV